MSSNNDNKCTPNLRFPGFNGEWEEKKFGDVILEDRTVSKTDNEDILLTSSIEGMFLNSEVFSHQRGQSTIGYRKIKKGMLVLSAQNLHLGNANVNMRFDTGLVSPAYKTYIITGCLPEFMYQWVKKENTKQFFFNATTQGASECRRNVVWDTLYNQTLLLPPTLAEQQKISECLSAVDESIAAQQEKVDALKAHKKGLMQQLFPQDGETTPRLRFPGFEGEWIVLKIAQLCSVNRGVRVTRRDLIDKGKYPVFQNTNVPLGYYNLYNVEANNPYVIIGGSAGSMGFCKTEFWAADDCAYFSDNNELDKYFLYLSLLLHAPEIKDNIRGGNIPRLDRKSIEDIRISLPNLPEQRKIASCLSLFDDTITVEKQKIEALKDHKKGLMQQLFPNPNNK